MSHPGSVRLKINLTSGISTTSESFDRDTTILKDEDDSSDADQIAMMERYLRDMPGNSLESDQNEEKPKVDDASVKKEDPDMVNISIATHTANSRKRKQIKTNFDDGALPAEALAAQQKEKERLERQKQRNDENDHISQMAALIPQGPLPEVFVVEDDFMDDLQLAEKRLKEGFSNDPEIIELSSDEEDVRPVIRQDAQFSFGRNIPSTSGRGRWSQQQEMDAKIELTRQQKMEQRRLRKRRKSGDLESKELKEGKLLVNAGKPECDPDIFVAPHLTHTLQPHQLGGIRFMYDNVIESIDEYKKSDGFGCILAHSMGLGKTIQVITFTEIFFRSTNAHKALVIVPINTIQNWLAEYNKWMPEWSPIGQQVRKFNVWILGDAVKGLDSRVKLIEDWHREGGVLLIGYEMFRMLLNATSPKKKVKGSRIKLNLSNTSTSNGQHLGNVNALEKETTGDGRDLKEINNIVRAALLDPGPDLVICDEGHKIKNLNTNIAAALNEIKTRRRIVLTGYPLQNNLMEYFCMVDFVRPMFLGTKKSFGQMFEKPIKNGQCVDSTNADQKLAAARTHVLKESLKGFVQRRTHSLLKQILPQCREFVVLLRKSPIQHALYKAFVLYARSEMVTGNTQTFNPLKAFSACCKIWNHPDVLHTWLQKKKEIESKEIEISIDPAKPSTSQCDPFSFGQLPTASSFGAQQQLTINDGVFFPFQNDCELPLQQQPFFTPNNQLPFTSQPNNGSFHIQNGPLLPALQYSASNPNLPNMSELDRIWANMCKPVDQMIDSSIPSSTCSDKPGPSSQNNNVVRKAGDLRRQGKSGKSQTTIASLLAEELEMDAGLKYDWADLAMRHYQPGNIENGYKLAIAFNIIDEATKRGEKTLLFSQNLTTLSVIEDYLSRRKCQRLDGSEEPWSKNINYFRFDGTTNGVEREKLINRFNSDPAISLFLISTRAGSLGINLVSANRCILFDACWNPCHDAQAVCRVYRYGQQRRTYIYRLILDNSMERSIFNRQISKCGLQQRVVDDVQVEANITRQELENLLVYDESLDVVMNDWKYSDWEIDDDVLKNVAGNHHQMFAEPPFLHESLMLEREEQLSEQEKLEAQLLFEKERAEEVYPLDNQNYSYGSSFGSSGTRGPRFPYNSNYSQQFPFSQSQRGPLDAPALRSTPIPRHLQAIGSYSGGLVGLPGSGGATMASLNQFANYPSSSKPFPSVQETQQSVDPRFKLAQHLYTIPGIRTLGPSNCQPQGVVQRITYNQDLNLRVVSELEEYEIVPAETELILVVTGNGTFIRHPAGKVYTCEGTPLNIGNIFSNATPSPARLRLPPNSGRIIRPPNPDDIIELD